MEEKHHSDAPRAEVEDQFQCKADGCKQTVPTDGYCTLHSKKHDLSLNLQMPQKTTGGGLLFADQTPTPTRLIGKCEEVGLFEDLQKVNPFDETFRRAVESGASSVCSSDDQSPLIPSFSVPCCRAVEGETLHTPHIFPSGIDRSSLLDGIASGSEKNAAAKQQKPKNKASGSSPRGKQQQQQPQPQQTQPQQTQPQQTQPQSQQQQQQQQLQAKQVEQPPKSTMATNSTTPTNKPKSVKKTPAKRKTPAAAVEILPKPSTTQSSLITDEPIPLIIIPPDHVPDTTLPAEGIVLVKKKLKEHLAKVRETGPLQKESAPAVKKAKRSEQKPDTSNKVTKPTDLPDALNERAILKQERWKAAAKRYRMRLKISQDQQLQRNIELEAENHRLRTQLAEMKAAHRNCNVTCSSKLVQGTSQNATLGSGSRQQEASNTVLWNATQQHPQVLVLQQPQQQQPLIVQQQPAPLSIPQQRLITSHIIDSNSFNRLPFIFVMGSGTTLQTVVPNGTGSATAESASGERNG